MNTRAVGTEYEEKACNYLVRCGFRILERNYRCRIGEIDIIARDGEYLVFVEVKYRLSKAQGGAAYTIPVSKQRTIARVAQWYMKTKGISLQTYCRFDAVLFDGDDIEHIKDAWRLR